MGKIRLSKGLFIGSASLFVMLITAEILVRSLDLDFKRMKLYWQLAALHSHQKLADQDPRIYGYKHNYQGLHEDDQGGYTIKINSLGFRDPERILSVNSRRLFIVGASNTFGAGVENHETFSFQLEKILKEKQSKEFEVWNAGVNAYNLNLKSAYAKEIIEKYHPEIIIFQFFPPKERRAFLYDTEARGYFDYDSTLYAENTPNLLGLDCFSFHETLSIHSALYRLSSLFLYHHFHPGDVNEGKGIYVAAARYYSEKRFLKLKEKHPKIKMFFYDSTNAFQNEDQTYLGTKMYVPSFDSHHPKRSDLHPDPPSHLWHAQNLYEILVNDGWI